MGVAAASEVKNVKKILDKVCVSVFEPSYNNKYGTITSIFSYDNVHIHDVPELRSDIKDALDKELFRKNLDFNAKFRIKQFVEKEFATYLTSFTYEKSAFEFYSESMTLSLKLDSDSVIRILFNPFGENSDAFFSYHQNKEILMNGLGSIENIFKELNELFPQPLKLSEETYS